MAYEICGYMFADGSTCDGLYDPETNPAVPCIFPDDPIEDCVQAILEGTAVVMPAMVPGSVVPVGRGA